MAKIQSKHTSTRSTKLGASIPKAPTFTKEQSAYVAGLLTGRGMGGTGGGSPHTAAFMPVSGDVYDPSAQTMRQQQQAEMQKDIDQIVARNIANQEMQKDIDQTVAQNIVNQESVAARYRSIANETPLLDPVSPQQAQANTIALEEEQARASRGVETYDPALSKGIAKRIPKAQPIDYQPNIFEKALDEVTPYLSGEAVKEAYAPKKQSKDDVDLVATPTIAASMEKINPAKGEIKDYSDVAKYWATRMPAWMEPKVVYDENNEPFVTMHTAVLQRILTQTLHTGRYQSTLENAERIEQEATQGVSPEVVQGTHDAQYTVNQMAQNRARQPSGRGGQQRINTVAGSPYEDLFLDMLRKQYPQLSTEELLRILRGQ